MARARQYLHRIIFEHDTAGGRAFDVVLITAILASVVVVMLDSVQQITTAYGAWLYNAEWFFTIAFTIEYLARLYSAPQPAAYARSFFGVVDLLAIMPTYLSIVFPSGRFLLTVRILRVIRIFRVLKLAHYVGEAGIIGRALRASRYKITVFLLAVLTVVVIVGSLMYLIEGAAAGFTSIPRSIYWAVVTLTTVGYGDIAPRTAVGQSLAALLMITGYGVIAVPTGIVTVELGRASGQQGLRRQCAACGAGPHEPDATYCKYCGQRVE